LELPERRDVWDESDETVDDGSEEDRGDDSKRDDIEEDFGEEVGEGRVVSVGSEDGEAGASRSAKVTRKTR